MPSAALWVGVLAVAAAGAWYAPDSMVERVLGRRGSLGDAQPWEELTDIWTEEEADALMESVKEKGLYKSAADDFSYTPDNIGEAQPVGADGSCPHPYLVRSTQDSSRCILPGRVDVAHHYLRTGGVHGWRESYERLVSRMLAFQHIYHARDGASSIPGYDKLFNTKKYAEAATRACEGRSVFDPIQLGIIVNLPGQNVGMHFDVPWFWGATRYNTPLWLLVVMEQSGLFADLRVRQIQGVAYLHRWRATPADGGGFVFYPNGTAGPKHVFPPRFNQAIVVDGSVVAHATQPFRPADRSLPTMPKDQQHVLSYAGDDRWRLLRLPAGRRASFAQDVDVNGQGVQELRSYNTSDLRIALVWRARCFESDAERARWHDDDAHDRRIPIPDILNTLEADMRRRGVLAEGAPRPAPLDFALLLLDTYVQYPAVANPLRRLNYCIVPKLMPFTAPLFSLFCE